VEGTEKGQLSDPGRSRKNIAISEEAMDKGERDVKAEKSDFGSLESGKKWASGRDV